MRHFFVKHGPVCTLLLSLLLLFSSFVPSSIAETTGVGPGASQNNIYNAQLISLEAQWTYATAPQAATLLGQIYSLRDYVDDPGAVEQWMHQVADDPKQLPLVRDEALRYLALIDFHMGRLVAGQEKLRTLGFVREWAVIGPFPVDSLDYALDTPLGPERGIGDERFTVGARRAGWRKIPAPGAQFWTDLSAYDSHPGVGIRFAGTWVYTPEARAVALRFGADGPAALYVNGIAALRANGTGAGFDQYVVSAVLRAGWNSVVLKLASQDDAPARFALRVTEPAGTGIRLNTSTQHQQGGPEQPTLTAVPAQDLVAMAKAAVDADPSGAKLQVLGRLEHDRQRGAELEHLREAAERAPSAEAWRMVANECGEPSCTFAALNSALRSDPNNEPALIELANYYVARNQLEKARNLLKQAIHIAPNDFVARSRLADVYVSAALNSVALTELRKLDLEFPAPLWLRRRLAERYTDFGLLDDATRALNQALIGNYDGAVERELLVHLAERHHDAATLTRAYEQAIELNPADVKTMAQLGLLEAGQNGFAGAEKLLRHAMAIDEDDADLHLKLADVLSRARNSGAAQQELARALQLDPRADAVRRRVALTENSEAQDPDSEYLVNVAQLAATSRDFGKGASNATELADIRVERIFENGLSSARVQQVVRLDTDQAVRDFRIRSVQYSPTTQDLQILHARVYKADGRVLEGEEAGEDSVADTDVAMYYDVRARAIRFPALEKGDLIELDYRISPTVRSNPYGDYFGELVTFRSPIPEKLQRLVLITPADRHFNIVESRMPSPGTVTQQGDSRVYRWDVNDLAALSNEPRSPALTEVAPYVHVSNLNSWSELGRWYAQLIRPQFALDANLRQAAARILNGKRTELEKISAVHEFVLRNTHYVAMEFGIYSYKPYPVTQVYSRRFGDCKDKASLMIALLRQAGIEADIALVRTRRMGDISDRATSIAPFNHAIVYVPKWDLWLDGTAEYAGAHELPLDDQGAIALVVGLDGTANLRRIPTTQAAENYTRRTVHAQVERDGTVQFKGTAFTKGEDAPGLRREYEVTERQRDSFRDRLAEVFPSVRVDDVTVAGAHNLDQDVTVDFRGELDTFSGRLVLSLASSWMRRPYVSTLAPLASRTQDLLLPAPWTTEEELHFQIPAGAVISSVPSDTNLQTPFGSALLRYERHGRELVIRTSVQFRKLRITAAEYPAFRDYCQQVERAFRGEVKVTLGG
jgi:transglutaminase-like putative cysteine protease